MKLLAVSLLVCGLMALTTACDQKTISCPRGWKGYNGRCFLYVPSPMTWADAEKNCQQQNGNLASVKSVNEYQAIQSMIQRLTQAYPVSWLGGSDAEQEGTWFWSDGTPFSFNYWAPGQPDNAGGAQNCLQMNYGDQKKYDDNFCSEKSPSVCARKP